MKTRIVPDNQSEAMESDLQSPTTLSRDSMCRTQGGIWERSCRDRRSLCDQHQTMFQKDGHKKLGTEAMTSSRRRLWHLRVVQVEPFENIRRTMTLSMSLRNILRRFLSAPFFHIFLGASYPLNAWNDIDGAREGCQPCVWWSQSRIVYGNLLISRVFLVVLYGPVQNTMSKSDAGLSIVCD